MFPLLALAVSASAAVGEDLWRGSASSTDCQLALHNEIGGVRVITGSPKEPPEVTGDSGLAIDVSSGHGMTMLTVARQTGGSTAAAAVELSVPPGCLVAVRTEAGPVTVELGPERLPLAVDTTTGDITARVDPGHPGVILWATSGEVTTDYEREIDLRRSGEPARYGSIPIGLGITKVRLTSLSGAIRVQNPTASSSVPR